MGDDEGEDWRSRVGERTDAPLSVDMVRAKEPGRGREADTPEAIPLRGWKDILLRVFWSISANRILATSGGVTFFALLAIFPAIATVVSLYGLFADAKTIGEHLSILAGLLPRGVLMLLEDQIVRVAGQGSGQLGTAFAIGLLVAFWSANSGVGALFDALNVVHDEKEKRSLLTFYATTFLFTIGAVGFAILAILGVVVLPALLSVFGYAAWGNGLISILRWPVLLAVIIGALASLYRYGPSRRDPKWRWVTPGSVVASALWIAGSMVFSWYVTSFDSYTRTYGSLGAAVGFMTWIWLSVVIVLLGAELNAEMEHQTARDTTQGRPKPLGLRGAMMADHVGKAQG